MAEHPQIGSIVESTSPLWVFAWLSWPSIALPSEMPGLAAVLPAPLEYLVAEVSRYPPNVLHSLSPADATTFLNPISLMTRVIGFLNKRTCSALIF